MTEEERQYLIQAFITVGYDRPFSDIKKELARQFGHPFTDVSLNAEKFALYRKIRNGGFADTGGTEEERLNAIGRALETATRFADPKNLLMAHQLTTMVNLFLAMQSDGVPPTIPFDQFQSMVCAKLNFPPGRKGWFKAFVDGTGNKYNLNHHTKWRQIGEVPSEVLADLEAIDLDIAIESATKPNVRWGDELKQELRTYTRFANGKLKLVEGHTYESVAAAMTERFQREISEGAVKRQVYDLKKEMEAKRKEFFNKLDNIGPAVIENPPENTAALEPVDTD